MRHRRCGLSTYRLNDIGKGDKHPAYAPGGARHPLPYVKIPRDYGNGEETL